MIQSTLFCVLNISVTRLLTPINDKFTGNERINALTFEELSNNFAFRINSEAKVNTFEEFLEFNSNLNPSLKLMIEIKATKDVDSLVKILIEMFKKYQLFDVAVVASFNPIILYKLRKFDPKIVSLLLVKDDLFYFLFHESTSLPTMFENLPNSLKSFIKVNSKIIDFIYFNTLIYVVPSFVGAGVLGIYHDIFDKYPNLMNDLERRGYGMVAWTVNEHKKKEKLMKMNKKLSILTDHLF